jgi:hypothetical protein
MIGHPTEEVLEREEADDALDYRSILREPYRSRGIRYIVPGSYREVLLAAGTEQQQAEETDAYWRRMESEGAPGHEMGEA